MAITDDSPHQGMHFKRHYLEGTHTLSKVFQMYHFLFSLNHTFQYSVAFEASTSELKSKSGTRGS